MRVLVLIFFVLYTSVISGKTSYDPINIHHPSLTATNLPVGRTPPGFTENTGQVTDQHLSTRPDIQFKVSAAPGLNIFIGGGAIHYQFSKSLNGIKGTSASPFPKSAFTQTRTMYRMDVELAGANKNAKVITEETQDYYENHIIGDICGRGSLSHLFRKITYQDIYPHIDWVLYLKNGTLEYEFVVKEGGNTQDIQLKYGGATTITLNTDGSVTTATPLGLIKEHSPVSYQRDGKAVKSKFVLTNNILAFETGCHSGTLIIDPTLEWGTYFGGTGGDYGQSTTTDDSGNVYVTGWTNSTSNIATSGAYEATYGGGTYDAFLAKFSSAGTMLWATYYGGSGEDVGFDVSTDKAGNAYMTGWTNSTSGIATHGAYQTTYSGGIFDAFLAKFNSTGALQWATYYGGSDDDQGKGVATDSTGNVYLTGWTNSTSGIATPGAYQFTYGGGAYDAFLAKFDSSGSRQWSTYFGGSGEDVEYGIASDDSANIYITGYTPSLSGIATPGAYQTFEADGGSFSDAFLAKFNTAGAIQWATYYGGTGSDYGQNIDVDKTGGVYITGFTNSTSSIATPGAYHDTYAGGVYDVFLAKFSYSGSMLWATYFGGSDADYGHGVATDDSANVYITGYTASTSEIATPDGYDTAFSGGGDDDYLAKFNGSSGALLWSTYYGGTGDDEGWSVTTFSPDLVYISGNTTSLSGIATAGAYQTVIGGSQDAFLAKFVFCTVPVAGPITGIDSVCIDSTILLTDSFAGGIWSSSDVTRAVVTGGIVTGRSTGTDTIRYSIPNPCGNATAEKLVYITRDCTEAAENISFPAQGFILYPNPAQGELNLSSADKISEVIITNVLGQIVYAERCNATSLLIDILSLPPGVYLAKINGSKMRRFVKE